MNPMTRRVRRSVVTVGTLITTALAFGILNGGAMAQNGGFDGYEPPPPPTCHFNYGFGGNFVSNPAQFVSTSHSHFVSQCKRR